MWFEFVETKLTEMYWYYTDMFHVYTNTNELFLFMMNQIIDFHSKYFKQTSNESVWYKVWYFFWKSIISNVRIFVNFCLYGLWLSSIQRIDRLLMMKQHDAIFMPHARKTQAKNTFLVIWDQKCQL